MFSSIQIERYRGFENLEMTGLGRVNLLVGSNNTGKTSILEAIYLLDAMGDPSAIWKLLSRRGEWLAPARRTWPWKSVRVVYFGDTIRFGFRQRTRPIGIWSVVLSNNSRRTRTHGGLALKFGGDPQPTS